MLENIFLPIRPNNVGLLDLLCQNNYADVSRYFISGCYGLEDINRLDNNVRAITMRQDSKEETYQKAYVLEPFCHASKQSTLAQVLERCHDVVSLYVDDDNFESSDSNYDNSRTDLHHEKMDYAIANSKASRFRIEEVIKPVIIVGSVIGNSVKTELTMSIRKQLEAIGLRILVIGVHPIHFLLGNQHLDFQSMSKLNYIEKTRALACYIHSYLYTDMIDVVVIEVPLTLIKFNNKYLGSMGEYMSILSSFMQNIYVVINTPLNFRFKEFGSMYKELLKQRYGVRDAYNHYSNEYIFFADFNQNSMYRRSFLRTDPNYIDVNGHNIIHSTQNAHVLRTLFYRWSCL